MTDRDDHGYKPDGHPTVSPYLIVDDAVAEIRFLEEVFDGVEIGRHLREDGRIAHAEVRIEDSVVMFGQSLEGWPPMESHAHVYVRDVDATHRRALDAGATSVQEPRQQGDPDRRGGVKDPNGITWWIATRVGAAEPD